MEKIFYMVLLIILALVIIVAVVVLLPMIKGSANERNIELNQACLGLIKMGCDESMVMVDSKSFERICSENNMKLDDCKKFCGC